MNNYCFVRQRLITFGQCTRNSLLTRADMINQKLLWNLIIKEDGNWRMIVILTAV